MIAEVIPVRSIWVYMQQSIKISQDLYLIFCHLQYMKSILHSWGRGLGMRLYIAVRTTILAPIVYYYTELFVQVWVPSLATDVFTCLSIL